jgi:hypothetical protein
MAGYRVGKIKNTKSESIENIDFDSLEEAEKHAQKTSLYDDIHFYIVEEKNALDDYQILRMYKHGRIDVSF